MKINGWILVFAIFLTGPVLAKECVKQSEMAEIARHYSQFRHLARADYCYDGSETSHLIAGIMFMRKTQFASNMPASKDQLFSGRFGSDWFTYLVGRIDDFNVERSCPKGVGAFVRGGGWFGKTMYVCPYLLSDNFTAMDRASVFMHEARHMDGYPHTTCRRGPRAGIRGACDTRISDGGSYAVSVETYAQIGKYSQNLHPAFVAYAKASAVVYADEAFDTPTRVDRDHHFILMAKNKKFHLLDVKGKTVATQALGDSPFLGKIIMRSQHMILLPDDRSKTVRYVFSGNEGEIQQQAGRFAEEYNALSVAKRKQVVDFHVSGQWRATIEKNNLSFICGARTRTATNVAIPSGEVAASVVYPQGYSRSTSNAHLAMQSGKIYEFGCSGTRPYVRQSNQSFDRQFKRVHKSGNVTIGLTAAGEIYRLNAGGISSLIKTPLNGTIYEIAPKETHQFF